MCTVGIIATNVTDARETAASILDDIKLGRLVPKEDFHNCVLTALQRKDVVTWEGYQRIEQRELADGRESFPPRPRLKIEDQNELLRLGTQLNGVAL